MAGVVSHDLGASPPEAGWLAIERFWQLPLIMTTSWCNALTDTLWPPAEAHQPHADDHEQLVVPEPLEVEGEPGLFA
jgi:hypothetical protein